MFCFNWSNVGILTQIYLFTGCCQYLSTLNIQTEIGGIYGTKKSDDGIFGSVAEHDYGKNKTIIELTDLHPSVLWNVHDDKGSEVMVKAEDGYKIVVAIVECSIQGADSYVKISPSKSI